MTAIEREILDQLIDLEAKVASLPTATTKPDLRPHFARLSELTETLPASTDPTLLHYLHKHSYEKARRFLEGRESENTRGNCHGHV